MKSFTIDKFDATQRVDRYLAKKFPGCPKSLIHKWIRTKKVKVNAARTEPSFALSKGDEIQLYLSDDVLGSFHDRKQGRLEVVNQRLIDAYIHVIHEDEDILVLDKSGDIAVHQGLSKKERGFHEYSLLDIVRAYAKSKNEPFVPSLVHRLDKFTSGVILCGKNPIALRFYSEVFREHKNQKIYLALVKGRLKKPEGTIRLSLEKIDDIVGKMQVSEEGKLSTTRYKEVQSFGNPLAGDYVYGDKRWNDRMRKEYGLKRIFLHAWKLDLPQIHEKGGWKFTSPLPDELEKVLKVLETI